MQIPTLTLQLGADTACLPKEILWNWQHLGPLCVLTVVASSCDLWLTEEGLGGTGLNFLLTCTPNGFRLPGYPSAQFPGMPCHFSHHGGSNT